MEILQDINCIDGEGDGRKAMASTSSTPSSTSGYRLFGREASVHNCMGGGKGENKLFDSFSLFPFHLLLLLLFYIYQQCILFADYVLFLLFMGFATFCPLFCDYEKNKLGNCVKQNILVYKVFL